MGKYNWQSNDKEMAEFFRQSQSESGEAAESTSPLPYRFMTLDKLSNTNKWTAQTNRTVYRFFSDIRQTVKPLSNGSDFIDLRCDGVHFRQQMMLEIWTDLADIPSNEIPWYLRRIPVPGYTPLSKAIGFMTNGRPNRFILQRESRRTGYHPVNGFDPLRYYWAAAHVIQFVDQQVIEGPVILLLKPWQVTELLKVVDNWREIRGSNWDLTGFPLHILNLTMSKPLETGLKVTPGGTYREEDSEVWDMIGRPMPDFDDQADALYDELDELLFSHGCALKGWPMPESHPDGWEKDQPLVVIQRNQWEKSEGVSQGLEVFSSKPDTESLDTPVPTNGRWDQKETPELLQIAEQYGVKVATRSRNNRDRIIALIEKAQASL